MASFEEHDRRFLERLDGVMDEAARRCGARWGCSAGRSDCCIGPFPINLLDARRLLRGLGDLRRRDPGAAARLVERAEAAARLFLAEFPGDARTGVLADDEIAQERFFEGHSTQPCPALDPSSGRCELYAHRPWTCRTYGPPIRVGAEDLPPCPYCFAPATGEALERLRVEPDPEGLEDALVDALEREEGITGETVVALGLLGLPQREPEDFR